jgi:hypothetical protein
MYQLWKAAIDYGDQITYHQAEEFSPLYSCAAKQTGYKIFLLNGFLSYHEVSDFLYSNTGELSEKSRQILFDILYHYILDVELRKGLDVNEYHMGQLHQIILKEEYGLQVKEWYLALEPTEQRKICYYLHRMYEASQSEELFIASVTAICKDVIIYKSKIIEHEFLIYFACEENEEERSQFELVKSLFLPLRVSVCCYWDRHFGVVGSEETMQYDDIIIY